MNCSYITDDESGRIVADYTRGFTVMELGCKYRRTPQQIEEHLTTTRGLRVEYVPPVPDAKLCELKVCLERVDNKITSILGKLEKLDELVNEKLVDGRGQRIVIHQGTGYHFSGPVGPLSD